MSIIEMDERWKWTKWLCGKNHAIINKEVKHTFTLTFFVNEL